LTIEDKGYMMEELYKESILLPALDIQMNVRRA
jgi:hypothetical protein